MAGHLPPKTEHISLVAIAAGSLGLGAGEVVVDTKNLRGGFAGRLACMHMTFK